MLFIADEARNLGAEQAVNYLPLGIEYRLALSATLRRYFDEEGTQLLFDYFGESVYQFTLKDAIGVCLTPYDYFQYKYSSIKTREWQALPASGKPRLQSKTQINK